MKKLVLGIAIVLLLVLSACSLQDYLPDNNSSSVIVLNDTFEVVSNNSVNNSSNTIINTSDSSKNTSLIENNSSDESSSDESSSDESLDVNTSILSTITVTEGDLASLAFLNAQDPDGDSVKFTYSEPFATDGTWQTSDGDEGKYLVTVTASDGLLSTSEKLEVIVLPSNKAPVITCPADLSVDEGDLINLNCKIFDKEGDNISYVVSGFMNSMSYQSNFNDSGKYLVTVTASDGQKTSSKVINLIINNVNRAPVIKPVKEISVTEGDIVDLSIIATDADGDNLSIIYPYLFNDAGVWKTKKGDAGNYELEGFVNDGTTDVSVPISIVVNKLNVAPKINNLKDITVTEGDEIIINVNATDADNDDLVISLSGFMSTSSYQTNFDDAGEYVETVTVSDATHTISKDFKITVLNKNRPPVFIVN